MPYILLDTGDPKAKAYEKAEDPKYAKEHNLKVDYNYYFINKFLNPVCDLIEPLFEDPKEEIFGELLTRVKPKRRPKKKTEADIEGQQKISDMFKTLKNNHVYINMSRKRVDSIADCPKVRTVLDEVFEETL